MDTHTELLMRAGRRDAQAFERLHAAFFQPVTDFVASRCRSLGHHDREDIVQEIFARVWQASPRFKGDSSARTFIFAVARNVVREGLRRKVRRGVMLANSQLAAEEAPCPASDRDARWHDEIRTAIRESKASMTVLERQAFELCCVLGIPYLRAAHLAGCAPSRFAKRLSRARRRVLSALERIRQTGG